MLLRPIRVNPASDATRLTFFHFLIFLFLVFSISFENQKQCDNEYRQQASHAAKPSLRCTKPWHEAKLICIVVCASDLSFAPSVCPVPAFLA